MVEYLPTISSSLLGDATLTKLYILRSEAGSALYYENTPIQIYWKFYYQKMFHISSQNIDCGYSLEPPRRGGSNGYPQSMFLSRNKKNNVYPCKLQFCNIKVGFQGVKII